MGQAFLFKDKAAIFISLFEDESVIIGLAGLSPILYWPLREFDDTYFITSFLSLYRDILYFRAIRPLSHADTIFQMPF